MTLEVMQGGVFVPAGGTGLTGATGPTGPAGAGTAPTFGSYVPVLSQGASTNIAKTIQQARYYKHDKLVTCWVTLAPTGTGTASAVVLVSLPFTPAAAAIINNHALGVGMFYDDSASTFWRVTAAFHTSGNVMFYANNATGVLAFGLAGAPFAAAIANLDGINFTVTYEAAA